MPTMFDRSALDYFSTPGLITTPGHQVALLHDLPTDLPSLCRVVQGLMIHVFWAEQYGIQLSAERKAEVQLRWVNRQLAHIQELDARPFYEPRPPEKRLVGNCRDFSVLLTTILRQQGVPARARCGFGRYFLPNHYEDHWVCEYWNSAQQRWILVDAQLDELQQRALKLPFDPLDVPRDQFIVGGQAWQLCRRGEADPDTFGIFEMKGLWFVRGDFVRDVAALNKVELLPWDSWGLAEARDEDLTPADWSFLDDVAALTCGDVPAFAEVRQRYESDDRLRVPPTVRSYTQSGPQSFTLAIN